MNIFTKIGVAWSAWRTRRSAKRWQAGYEWGATYILKSDGDDPMKWIEQHVPLRFRDAFDAGASKASQDFKAIIKRIRDGQSAIHRDDSQKNQADSSINPHV